MIQVPNYASPISGETPAKVVVAVDEQGRDINKLILDALTEQNSLLVQLNATLDDLADGIPGGNRVMRTRSIL